MNEVLAFFTLDSKFREVTSLSLEKKRFRFKCKRCAALCCKLGGPVLTRKDVERIADEGYSAEDFLNPVSRDGSLRARGSMKKREDGSCVFLEFDDKLNCHKCGIHDFRPVLCRLYPFSFEIVDSDRFALKFIPCCRGLNNRRGELVNENFVSRHLLKPLLEAMELHKMGVRLS
jgi:Fe-S-cluster containining protein